MRLAAAVLVAVLCSTRPASPVFPQTIDRVLGAWQGTVEHQGETAEIIFEFVRSGDRVLAVASVPVNHAWRFPVAAVTMSGQVVSGGPFRFELDAAAGTLTTVLPSDMVPKYSIPVVLNWRDAVTPQPRPKIDAPVRQPAWTVPLGASSWGDVALVDGLIVVGTDEGRLQAVDVSGRERWSFKAEGPIRAAAAADGGDLLIPADDGVLYRLDARSGRERWRKTIARPFTRLLPGDRQSRYENRASGVAVAGGLAYVGTHEGRLVALDARTGDERWSFTAGDAITATPAVDHGRLYVGSFDGFIYALDARTGALAWKHQTGGAVTTAVAVAGGRVFAGSRSYDAEALDAQTGQPIWTRYLWFSWVESPFTLDGSRAYVGSSDAARVYALDAATGRRQWTSDVGGSAWGRPVVAGDDVYESVAGVANYMVPHGGGIVAIGKDSGRLEWWYPTAAPSTAAKELAAFGFAGSIAVDARHVYAAGIDGTLYAFPR